MIIKQREIQTNSPEETRTFGEKAGGILAPGTVIALTGDLGSGKTCFVQGLARGLGVSDEYYITSPSYTLINAYPARHPLYHADLYRLDGLADIEDIGLSDILHRDGIVAIEWADRVDPEVLADHIAMAFEILDDESRRIRISAYGDDAGDFVNTLFKR